MVFNKCVLLAFSRLVPSTYLSTIVLEKCLQIKNANVFILDIAIGALQLLSVLCAQFIV